jgi:hypothetical protein
LQEKQTADERTRTAFLLITSKPVSYLGPARNGCFAGAFGSALSAKYPQVSPNIASTADDTADNRWRFVSWVRLFYIGLVTLKTSSTQIVGCYCAPSSPTSPALPTPGWSPSMFSIELAAASPSPSLTWLKVSSVSCDVNAAQPRRVLHPGYVVISRNNSSVRVAACLVLPRRDLGGEP